MKILLTGNHNPYFTNTVELREKAVRDLGHELVFFNDRDFLLPGRVRQFFYPLRRWDLRRLNRSLLRIASAERPDICIILGGYRILADTIIRLKDTGTKTALWTSDVPLDFENVIKSAPCYDKVFCAGTEALEVLSDKGIGGAQWLPFACDPDLHHPADLDPDEKRAFGSDIIFIGSYYPNRARILQEVAEFDLKVYGPGWGRLEKCSPLSNKIFPGGVNYTEWVKMVSASKIVLSIHYQDSKTLCYQASPRIFETMACKGFLLCDRQRDVGMLFKDKEHLAFFSDRHDLREKVSYYLQSERERKRIRENGYREVIEKHTYGKRIEQILSYV